VKLPLTCLLLLIAAFAVLRGQSPAEQQDAEAAREKILKAADQLDMIEGNSEANKAALESMKADVAKLQDENTALKQQLADLQAAFDKEQAARTQERQVLLDQVAQMVAASKPPKKHSSAKADAADETAPPDAAPDPDGPKTSAAKTAESTSAGTTTTESTTAPKPQKGYYHIVESGETLTMITAAYRDHGVKVTVAQVRKANGLTSKSVLKVGQKLFIPKPES
jgi:LysM repeat protein